jgi:hypothetical protein
MEKVKFLTIDRKRFKGVLKTGKRQPSLIKVDFWKKNKQLLKNKGGKVQKLA